MERKIEELIHSLLENEMMAGTCDESEFPVAANIRRVETFTQAEMVTTVHGLVLTMTDGTEFQIDIVRSR